MSFEPLDTNSIREKINKLKDERINKLISEFENQLNIKIHSRFDDLKIEELKELLEKYDRKDEIQDMVEFGTWKQIDKLKELLREYGEYACQNEDEQIEKLKSLVTEYKHDNLYPPLPEKPDGSLFGIGFIYDFYEDYILWVITILEDKQNILAVHEHEGTLTIYSKYPYHLQEIDVENDDWSIFNFVPENGEWIEVERNYNFS
jgi:hypothetical protein